MAENSKIEWTDHTWNPWIGCTEVSPGCANCYARELMDTRYKKVKWGKGQPRQRTSEANWKQVERWDRQAEDNRLETDRNYNEHDPCVFPEGPVRLWSHRPRVFVASLSDWLDPEVPIEWLADLLDMVRRCKHLDFLMLTKRPELWWSRMEQLRMFYFANPLPDWWPSKGEHHFGTFLQMWIGGKLPHNVWIGTTVEDQKRADERIPELLNIPAKVRFLSCEPLLEPVDLSAFMGQCPNITGERILQFNAGIHWVICGGESGPHARPFNPEWARSLRDQCNAVSVPFFMKQMGGKRKPFAPIPDDLMIREFPQTEKGQDDE